VGSAVGTVGAHRQAAPARAALWFQLADLLVYPEEALIEEIRGGEVAAAIADAVAALPYPVSEFAFDGLPDEGPGLGSDYIRLFEVPARGTPCPLYGGALGGDRQATMEDLLRYYRHFGLSVAHAEDRDLPDSVPTVLEFLGYLVEREQRAEHGGGDERRAQRDVLERHLCRWAPIIRARVDALRPPEVYRATTALLEEFAAGEASALVAG
jgi:DMSO reductase family type II enzyme chaperone